MWLLLFLNFVGNSDTAKTAGRININRIFTLFGGIFTIIRKPTKDEARAQLNYNIVRNDDFDTTKEAERLDNGIFGELSVL